MRNWTLTPLGRGSAFQAPVTDATWGGRATRIEVDLGAIAENVRAIRRHIGSRLLITVVKANAYGHGAGPVATTAIEAGADWLATFLLSEAVALRKSGITAPILVLGPFELAEASLYSTHGLTASVNSEWAADALSTAASNPVDVHLQLDSGLHREGAATGQALALAEYVSRLPRLRLQGAFTHLARSDEPDAASNAEQLEAFTAATDEVEAHGIALKIKHAANSGAALHLSGMRLDAVRAGIATYGYAPDPDIYPPFPLRPALMLLSRVVRIHSIAPGTGVGYGHTYTPERPTTLALVPIGYGDGLDRRLGNGRGAVLVEGRRVSIVGRVSMDQITVDVTDVPDIMVGSEVVIVGRSGDEVQDAHTLAADEGTICYELLTSLAARVPRIYTRDGRVVGGN